MLDFETIEFDYQILRNRLRELAYLNAGIRITLSEEDGKSQKFYYKGGISQYGAVAGLPVGRVPRLVTAGLLFSAPCCPDRSACACAAAAA